MANGASSRGSASMQLGMLGLLLLRGVVAERRHVERLFLKASVFRSAQAWIHSSLLLIRVFAEGPGFRTS